MSPAASAVATDAATLKALPNGHRLSSSPFTVGGHRWRIDCYPNGSYQESAGHVSIFLVLDEDVAGEPSPAGHNFAVKDPWGFTHFVKRGALEQSRHLKDDSFTIRCDLVVVNGYKVRVLVPPSDLNQHLGDLLRTGKGADVVFDAGGEKFAAHRCVLAARSPVFGAELFGGSTKLLGSTSDLVRIDGMEAQVFGALLYFVYTDSLPQMKQEEEATMYQHLLVAADTYGMERLKLICEDKLCKHIDVGTVANILALAEAHRCHVLRSACLAFLGRKANLTAVMASDGFEHLNASCPSLVKELLTMHSTT
ncbi:hypothetical protein QYE76_004888 [Lolium multiflorum]|uniref:Uncharacterized protein n=1 Tax=Lolium multiflorum TaxID=4521 RepID=A0AAD8W2M7_LOLMU|nr:hypothetical protein QYE76_004888 [Lolium multiflorum]